MLKVLCLFLALLAPLQGFATPDFLVDSVFDDAAKKYGIDPILLYAVALGESAKQATGPGAPSVSPSPYSFHAGGRAFHASSRDEAVKLLDELTTKYGNHVDVGVMQINLHWNGDRVASPDALLDPATNIYVGAKVLSEALQSAPNNLQLGVGRYNTWSTDGALAYGAYVLKIYGNLKRMVRMDQLASAKEKPRND